MKKWIISGTVTALFVAAIAVAPIRALALDALSIFRVSQANTIRISVEDVQEFMTNAAKLIPSELSGEMKLPGVQHDVEGLMDKGSGAVRDALEKARLQSAGDFKGFDFKLPGKEKQTPEIYATDGSSDSVKLNVPAINKALAALNSEQFLPDSYDGAEITIKTPPAVAAVYDGYLLAATQMPVVEAGEDVSLSLIRDVLISSPLIPSNVAQQLAFIDVNSREIYLPVLVGISKEAGINGSTGYIYSASDFTALINALNLQELAGQMDEMIGEGSGSVIVWVSDGVIYLLGGEMPDTELVNLARSVK